MMSEDDKEWLKGTPFDKWTKRIEELEKKVKSTHIMVNGLISKEIAELRVDGKQDLIHDQWVNTQITELRDNQVKGAQNRNQIIGKLTELRDRVNLRGIETANNELVITELKEQIENDTWVNISDYHQLKEVLRELISIVNVTIVEEIDGESVDYYMKETTKLLKKLDGASFASHTVKDCEECNWRPKKQKGLLPTPIGIPIPEPYYKEKPSEQEDIKTLYQGFIDVDEYYPLDECESHSYTCPKCYKTLIGVEKKDLERLFTLITIIDENAIHFTEWEQLREKYLLGDKK